MSFAQLRAFHLVATNGGFSQAARDMAASQSTLSGQVRQLEAASGRALFERSQRGVRLTSDGAALFEITTRLFNSLAEARALLRSKGGESGRLRIGSDNVVHLLPILGSLRRRRPKLLFTIALHNANAVIDQLLEYRTDIGVTAQVNQDDRLHYRPLASMRLGVVIPRDHAWAEKDSLAISELEGCPFVLRERGSVTRQVFEENLAQHGVTLGPVLEVSTREGVREAIAAGFGVGAFAELESGYDSRLRYLPIRDASTTIDEHVVCLTERVRQPLIAEFFDCAAEAARRLGYGAFAPAAALPGQLPSA